MKMENCNSHQVLLVKSVLESSSNESAEFQHYSNGIILSHDNGSDNENNGIVKSTSNSDVIHSQILSSPYYIDYNAESETLSSNNFSNSIALTSTNSDHYTSCSSLNDTIKTDPESTFIIISPDSLNREFDSMLIVDEESKNERKSLRSLLNTSSDGKDICVPGAKYNEYINDSNMDSNEKKRLHLCISWQILIAVLTAASGNFAAGLILDRSKSWKVFRYTPELYYLVPILLSLKGNLEMTMVARLSTLANMGALRSFRSVLNILFYNISLVQTQAIVVSFLASIVTFIALEIEGESFDGLSIISDVSNQTLMPINTSLLEEDSMMFMNGNGTSRLRKCLLIFSTSLATANLACLISTILMILITVALYHLDMNPDNFVTALAASFGDVITSILVGLIGEFIYNKLVYIPSPEEPLNDGIRYYDDLYTPYPAIFIIMFFISLFPILSYFTCQSISTKKILLGLGTWIPILLSMLIAFVSGFVLRFGAVEYNFMSLFQPLINGVGGNLSAIITSRYSTELHVEAQKTLLHESDDSPKPRSKFSMVIKKSLNSFFVVNNPRNTMILILVMMGLVVHLFYGILAPMIHASDHHHITWLFYFFYIPAALFQVLILLILTRIFVDIVWWLGYDPDTSAIPILASMGDILGTLFLYVVFFILYNLNDDSANPPINSNYLIEKNNEISTPEMIVQSTNFTRLTQNSIIKAVNNSDPIRFVTTPNQLTTFAFINYIITAITTTAAPQNISS